MPLLKKYKLPAVLFVPTRVIDEDGYFWWDVLYLLCSNSENIQFDRKDLIAASVKKYLERIEQIASKSSHDRSREIYDLIENLLNSPEETRSKVAKYIFEIYESLDVKRIPVPTVLKWEDIKELQASKVEIGSHTISHRFLSTVAGQEVMDDLVGSKNKLEKVLNNKIRCFAYPRG